MGSSREHFEAAERHLLTAQSTAGRMSVQDDVDQMEIAESVVADLLFSISHGLLARIALDAEELLRLGPWTPSVSDQEREREQWSWALGMEPD